MPSFDAVSDLDSHELTNAVDQANRELSQRFDFKDTGASYELKEKEFTVSLRAPAEFQLKQMIDILTQRLAKRGIDVRCMEKKDAVSNLAEARQDVVLRHGIDPETGKKLQKIVKESKLKVQAQIQGEQLRITGNTARRPAGCDGSAQEGGADRPLQFKNFSRD
jgi:uncharacterized protein YajQ (UPF0234 family)